MILNTFTDKNQVKKKLLIYTVIKINVQDDQTAVLLTEVNTQAFFSGALMQQKPSIGCEIIALVRQV